MLFSGFRDRRAWACSGAALFASFFCLLTGLGSSIDQYAVDIFAVSARRPAGNDLVIVAIDEPTTIELGGYPPVRSRLAGLLKQIADCGPERVLVDLAFTANHNEVDDQTLEEAFAVFKQDRIALPLQWDEESDGHGGVRIRRYSPLERFGRHTHLVSVDFDFDSRGVVRDAMAARRIDEVTYSSASEWLARAVSSDRRQLLDTRIDPRSIPIISAKAVLHQQADVAARLKNKRVIIGLTLSKITQPVHVPVYGEIHHPLYVALAAESIAQHRSPKTAHSVLVALASIPLFYVTSFLLLRVTAWVSALVTTAIIAAWVAGSWSAFCFGDQELFPTAMILATLTAYASAEALTRKCFQGLRQAWKAVAENVDLQLANLFHSGADSIITFSPEGTILTVNRTAERLFGLKAEECIGKPLASILPDMADDMLQTARAHRPSRLEAILSTTDTQRHVDVAINAVSVESSWIGYASFRDISDLRAREEALRRQATQDSLTGLPNRAAFERHLEATIQYASQTQQSFSVFLMDLNKFKTVNDTLGHHVGDALLIAAGARFRSSIRVSDFVARLGGDEFAIVLAPGTDDQAAMAIAETIKDAIADIKEAAGCAVEAGTSIGLAMYPQHGSTSAELLQAADFAMYDAKRNKLRFKMADLAAATTHV
ncbi:MAG: diguanylate cyclase [Pirellulales bacterium]